VIGAETVGGGPRTTPRRTCSLHGRDRLIAVRAGHIWANALLNDRLPAACPSDVTDLPARARQGAAQTIVTAPHLAHDVLVRLFDDEDADVRKMVRSGSGTL
jgi:hypothetical protein